MRFFKLWTKDIARIDIWGKFQGFFNVNLKDQEGISSFLPYTEDGLRFGIDFKAAGLLIEEGILSIGG